MIYFLYLGFALALGIWASNKGRSGIGWFLLACLISPILAVVFFIATDQVEQPSNPQEKNLQRVKCPYCAEHVLPEAIKCKHCGSQLPLQVIQPFPEPEVQSDAVEIHEFHDDLHTRSTEKKFYIGLFITGLLVMILLIYFYAE